MILLDTNAIIWLGTNHRRTRELANSTEPMCVSPASLLELQYLEEVGKLRIKSMDAVTRNSRWTVDEPSPSDWFEHAYSLSWTRDVFDRLIVAHATSRRYKLATGDGVILATLQPRQVIEL